MGAAKEFGNEHEFDDLDGHERWFADCHASDSSSLPFQAYAGKGTVSGISGFGQERAKEDARSQWSFRPKRVAGSASQCFLIIHGSPNGSKAGSL